MPLPGVKAESLEPERETPRRTRRRAAGAPPGAHQPATRADAGEWYVERTRLDGQVDRKTGRLKIRPFVTQPALVSYGAHFTLKVGELESAPLGSVVYGKVDIGVTVPCYVEELDDVSRQVSAWVERRLDGELAEMQREHSKAIAD